MTDEDREARQRQVKVHLDSGEVLTGEAAVNWMRDQSESRNMDQADRWEQALRTAPGEGKEPFDLEVFKAVYLNFDPIYDKYGFDPDLSQKDATQPRPRSTWEQETRKWESQYYRAAAATLDGFAASKEQADWWDHEIVLFGGPDRPRVRPEEWSPSNTLPPFRERVDQAEHERLRMLADRAFQADGKERFDYNRFVVLLADYWPNVNWTREREIRWWTQRYYDHHPDILTLADFAAHSAQPGEAG